MADMDMDGCKRVLPQEIIRSILIRLPIKSLIRFQCVCKLWKNLFKTPSFISEHLQHSIHQNPLLFFEDIGLDDPYGACLLNREMRVSEFQIDSFIEFTRSHSTINACNGLICIALYTYHPDPLYLLVCNPAIRDVRLVSGGNMNCHLGFGFSPIVNDFRIVKIRDSDHGYLVNRVEVYSLKLGTWKEVEFAQLDGIAIVSDCFNFNGAILWFGSKRAAYEDGDDINIIVSFDIATELFTWLPMPPLPFDRRYQYRKRLTVYENKLALVTHTLNDDLESCLVHLWVMEEGTCAKRWCWTKKYTSSPYFGCLLVPKTIWMNEIVCNVAALPSPDGPLEHEDHLDGERKNVMLNFTTNEFKTMDIRRWYFGYDIFNYAESLVPVNNIHSE